ncbi:MAG: radical SAM protein [Chloroflexi bacterium]|nr:radical SAM protein [Chloroflexota bacterium]
MSVMNYMKFAPRILYKKGASPLYFVLFITKNCNARCGHCLLGSHERHTGELTIDEIEKVSRSMDDMIFFTPTGGEPFLRKDLPEIVKIFHKNNHAPNVGIPTNGSLTSRVVDGTREMLDSCPDMDLHIDISIDGVGEDHDKFRGFKGLFDRAIRTYRELRVLEKHYHNFSACIQIAVSQYNHDRLDEIYDYLKTYVGVNTVFTLLLRGGPKDPAAKFTPPIDPKANQFDIDNYMNFHYRLEEENKKRELSGYYKLPFGDFINAKRIIRPKLITQMVKERRFVIPCNAGTLGGNMFANGDVLACEQMGEEQVLGNVRDFDYDFKKIWRSQKADEVREWISKTKCYCTYECFMTVNILFNPLMYPVILKEWATLKWAQLRHGLSPEVMQAGPRAVESYRVET